MEFGTVDYVLVISPQNKFGDDRSSGGFWVNMWNIRCLLLSLFFFPNEPGGHTPKPIFTRNIANDVDPRIDVPFAVKIETFSNPWPSDPENRQNLAIFWTSKIFARFHLNISGLISNTPYSSSELHKSVIVNSQTGVENSKYVVVFDPLPIGHVIRGMRSQLFGH